MLLINCFLADQKYFREMYFSQKELEIVSDAVKNYTISEDAFPHDHPAVILMMVKKHLKKI